MALTIFRSSILIAAAITLFSGIALGQYTRTLTNNKLILNEISVNDTDETDFAHGDVDKDLDIDVVVGRKLAFTVDGPRVNILLLNDGAGTMTDVTATFTSWVSNPNNTREVQIVDFDGDTWLDVIFFNAEIEPTEIYLNLGNDVSNNWLGFAATPMLVAGGGSFHTCGGTALDYDNDGMMDIARADYRSSYENDLMRQSSPGLFTNMSSLWSANFRASEFGTRVQAHEVLTGAPLDLNVDGNTPDIAFFGSSEAKAVYADGMGGFLVEQFFSQNATYDGVVYDFNQDGRPDIFKVNDVSDELFLNQSTNGNGTIVESSGQQFPNSGGFGANPKLADFNGNGNMNVWVSDNDIDIPNCNNNTEPDLYEIVVNGGNVTVNNVTSSLNFTLDGVYDLAMVDLDGDSLPDMLGSGCDNGSPGWFLMLSDPSAMANSFHNEWTPNMAGILFAVRNVPASPNTTTLFNFFDVIPTGGDTSPGAFLGLRPEVITQVSINTPPFVVPMPVSAVAQDFLFQIPPLNIVGVDLLRLLSVHIDSPVGEVNIAPVTSITSF